MEPEYLVNWWNENDEDISPHAKKFSYHWENTYYKESGEKYVYCFSEDIFYRLLNRWNRIGGDYWKYWA